jgi:hypothetical protein
MTTIRALTVTLITMLASTARLPAPIREEPTPKPSVVAKPKTESKSSEKSSSTSESGMGSHSVTVVFTDNTRAAILFLKNYEGKPFTDVRTDQIVEQLRRALSTRFSNVSILENGSSSRSGGLTMLFDLQAHPASISFTANTVSFIATFKNSGGRTVQTISAAGKSTVPYPAFSNQFSKAVERAFADFSQKLAAAR